MDGREVVIVEAVRTPVGRGHPEKGYYKDVHPNELLGATFVEVLERAGVDGSEVGDVITGCVQQYGEQSYNIGRNAWLQAGLPIETPATTIDRQCGSAQQAVNFAAALDRERRPRRRDRWRRRAHGSHPAVGQHEASSGARLTVSAGARSTAIRSSTRVSARSSSPRSGPSPARIATRSRSARSSVPPARRRRDGSSARSFRIRSTATSSPPTRASAPRRRSRVLQR